MPDTSTTESRTAGLTRLLACRALDMAIDASAFRPQAGEARTSMLIARPAARLLMGSADAMQEDRFSEALESLTQVAQQAGTAAPGLVDGAGHRREVYYPLVLHLFFSAWASRRRAKAPRDELHRTVSVLLAPIKADLAQDIEMDWEDPAAAPRLAGALWRALVALEGALLMNDSAAGLAALGIIGRAASSTSTNGELHPQSNDDTPDVWVYQELTGLHALYSASQVARDAGWAARCGQVAQYHLAHTQPDYTTYQPWALACFAEHEATATFAQQQLHDVQTHLAIEGPGGALLPGLLLGDATAAMDGRIVEVWQRFRFQG